MKRHVRNSRTTPEAVLAPIIFLTLVLSAITLGCDTRSSSSIKPGDLRPGPIGPPLTDEQERRVRALQAVFAEVDSHPPEAWIENFRRDQHPDREIQIYEDMASAYSLFARSHELSPAEKQEVYSLVLMRSMMNTESVLERITLKSLTIEQAREVLAGYEREPQPIRIKAD